MNAKTKLKVCQSCDGWRLVSGHRSKKEARRSIEMQAKCIGLNFKWTSCIDVCPKFGIAVETNEVHSLRLQEDHVLENFIAILNFLRNLSYTDPHATPLPDPAT